MKKKVKKNSNLLKLVSVVMLILVLVFIINILNKDKYAIKIKQVDEYSPDVEVIVLKNNKEYKEYKYIKYDDKGKNIILCRSNNAVVNKYELDEDYYVIVLNDDKEVKAKLEKE